MTSHRKLLVLAGAIVVVALAFTLWPRPKGYTYQGKTVEEWFEVYLKEVPNPGSKLIRIDSGSIAWPLNVRSCIQGHGNKCVAVSCDCRQSEG